MKTSGCEVDAQVTLNSRNGEIVSVSDCILLEQNNNGLTALHMAVEYDYYWVAKRLLEAEANGDIESNVRAIPLVAVSVHVLDLERLDPALIRRDG